MKGLSLWQPWASLCGIGAKEYETRSWPTRYRGRIAIHAAKKGFYQAIAQSFETNEAAMEFHREVENFPGWVVEEGYIRVSPVHFPLGAFVATATLAQCFWVFGCGYPDAGVRIVRDIDTEKTHEIHVSERELLFGDWSSGRFVWRLEDVRALAVPLPATGRQGLWNIDEKIEREIASLERAVR